MAWIRYAHAEERAVACVACYTTRGPPRAQYKVDANRNEHVLEVCYVASIAETMHFSYYITCLRSSSLFFVISLTFFSSRFFFVFCLLLALYEAQCCA